MMMMPHVFTSNPQQSGLPGLTLWREWAFLYLFLAHSHPWGLAVASSEAAHPLWY